MSTFSLDEDQRQIKDAMGKFAAEEMRPIARDCDEELNIPDDFLDKSWELGIVTNVIPEKYGGYEFGRSVLNNTILTEELAYGDLSLAMAALAPNLFVLPVMEMGTDEQKERFLPEFCGLSAKVGSLAILEYSIAFDVSEIKTRATRSGNQYILNGQKCLVPMADKAEEFLVVARASGAAAGTGIDAFIVEKTMPGIEVSEKEKHMGLNALSTHTLIFEDCKVSADNRLGGEGGFDYNRLVGCCRIALAAAAVGLAGAVKDYCVDYARERIAFGQPIATRQSIAFMLADMAIEIDGARLLNYKAAWNADQNYDLVRIAYLSKKYASKWAFTIADNGVSILGGHGLIREHPVEMWFRNARAFSMLEGMIIV